MEPAKDGADNCEFIPLPLLDHKGKVASEEHCLLNVLGHLEAVDLALSGRDVRHRPQMLSS